MLANKLVTMVYNDLLFVFLEGLNYLPIGDNSYNNRFFMKEGETRRLRKKKEKEKERK